MKRVLEPELMEDEDQAQAYADADFEAPHSHFIGLFKEVFASAAITGCSLDLGCGPGDISFRFAASFKECTVDAVDGSATMLKHARNRLARSAPMHNRISFIDGMLPNLDLPKRHYDIVISNSLLHHLPDPDLLWSAIKRYSRPGSSIFVMDLLRPNDTYAANELVDTYAAGEPEVLRRDFYNSLLAAFTTEELSTQLCSNNLDYLTLKEVSDRHLTIFGRIR